MASVTFKRGTRAEIEATAKQDGQILMETDQNKKNKMYIDLPDDSRVLIGNSGEAIDTFYDNSTSGLDATNVQNAIDTLNSNLNDKTIQVYKYSSANPGNQKGNTYQYAPIRLRCLNPNDGARPGIGFENAGLNAGFLYLASDGNLYFMDHLGVDHKISMT